MAVPISVRSGSTSSNAEQIDLNVLASPPVATTNGFPRRAQSALIRRTRPSIDSAAPSTTPDLMQSSVRRPITRSGATISVAGSLDVFRNSDSADMSTPGAMTPPKNTPSALIQSNVVAVPISTTMQSRLYVRLAASVLMMRSAPTVSGSSTSSVMGSLERPSTTTGTFPGSPPPASANGAGRGGATQPR